MIRDGSIETARLSIRPFDPADAAMLVTLFADPQVSRFVGDGTALSREDADLWVSKSRTNLGIYGYGTGAVIERSSRRLIGWAGFARPQQGPEQLIYGLAAAHWRRGFGTEILKALIDFGLSRNIEPMVATVDPANGASIHLLTKHGFRLTEAMYGGEADTDLYERHRT